MFEKDPIGDQGELRKRSKMIVLDGSYKEGGGQIIRSALSLSSILKKPFFIKNIRANRQKPGLQPQHLTACLAAAKICQAKTNGSFLNSTRLTFHPNEIQAGHYTFDVTTAGSTILIAQTLIPILLFAKAPSFLTLVGGTHIRKSPCYDYFERIFLPAIQRLGAKVSSKCRLAGYYPKGGGIVEITIHPSSLKGCQDWQKIEEKWGVIRLSHLPGHIAEREKRILKMFGFEKIEIIEDDALSPGNAVTIGSGFSGAYVLGEIGKRAEEVANEAVLFFEEEKESIDRHLADQLLLYAVAAVGPSFYTTSFATSHLETHLYLIQQFSSRKISIETEDKKTTKVAVF